MTSAASARCGHSCYPTGPPGGSYICGREPGHEGLHRSEYGDGCEWDDTHCWIGPRTSCPMCGGTTGFSFDRSLCACGAMHDYCEDCGLPLGCPYSQPEVRQIDSAASALSRLSIARSKALAGVQTIWQGDRIMVGDFTA